MNIGKLWGYQLFSFIGYYSKTKILITLLRNNIFPIFLYEKNYRYTTKHFMQYISHKSSEVVTVILVLICAQYVKYDSYFKLSIMKHYSSFTLNVEMCYLINDYKKVLSFKERIYKTSVQLITKINYILYTILFTWLKIWQHSILAPI